MVLGFRERVLVPVLPLTSSLILDALLYNDPICKIKGWTKESMRPYLVSTKSIAYALSTSLGLIAIPPNRM